MSFEINYGLYYNQIMSSLVVGSQRDKNEDTSGKI